MIEDTPEVDTPVSPGKILMTKELLIVDIYHDRAYYIKPEHILLVRDACNDHIKRFGAIDLQGREVKLD